MRNMLKAGLAALVMLVAASPAAMAAGQPWACQFTAVAGLNWDGRQWKVVAFQEDPQFVLVQDGDVLTQKSVAAAITGNDNYYELFSCQREDGAFGHQIFCKGKLGEALAFSPNTGQGGVSKLYGLMDNDPKKRDTITVSHFTCQKY